MGKINFVSRLLKSRLQLVFATILITVIGSLPSYSATHSPFNYSKSPLDSHITGVGTFDDSRWIKLTYRGDKGGTVPALLILPSKTVAEQRVPCLLIIHGLGGRKETMIPIARLAAQDGYASLLIDLPGSGERQGSVPSFSTENQLADFVRGSFSEGVIDLRRGIDYLRSRKDIDSSHLGLIGLSLGGFMGVDVAGVDRRVKAVMLIATGGGLGNILDYQARNKVVFGGNDYSALVANAGPQTIESQLSDVDPINYIAAISPRPLLMENGDHDTVVPPEAAQNLFDTAGEPKHIDWFKGEGHIPNILGLYAALTRFLHENMPITVASR